MPDEAGDAAPSAAAAGAADPLWDDWEVPLRPPAPLRRPEMPELHLDGFDGPIDLLLDLVERERIDLARLSIRELIDQFVAALDRSGPHVPIERRADWLVLAARLIVLRSRLLFPATSDAAREAEREAVREIERLDELRFLRATSSWLQARPQLGQDVFARPPRGPDPRVASYMALLEACLALLEREEDAASSAAGEAAIYRPARMGLFRVPEALARIRAMLAESSEPAPLRVFLPRLPKDPSTPELRARSAVSSTFMAALELARHAELQLAQATAFGPIAVSPPGEREPTPEADRVAAVL